MYTFILHCCYRVPGIKMRLSRSFPRQPPGVIISPMHWSRSWHSVSPTWRHQHMVTGEDRGVHLSGSGYSELHSLALHCSNPSRRHSARDKNLLKLFPREVLYLKSAHMTQYFYQTFIIVIFSWIAWKRQISSVEETSFSHLVHSNPVMVRAWYLRAATVGGGSGYFWRQQHGGQKTSSWQTHDLGVTIILRTLQNFHVASDGVNHENLREIKVEIKFIRLNKTSLFFLCFCPLIFRKVRSWWW